jgi:hypothetical protein
VQRGRDGGRTRHEVGLVRLCEARGAGAHDVRRGGAGARGLEAGPSDTTNVLIEALVLYYPGTYGVHSSFLERRTA